MSRLLFALLVAVFSLAAKPTSASIALTLELLVDRFCIQTRFNAEAVTTAAVAADGFGGYLQASDSYAWVMRLPGASRPGAPRPMFLFLRRTQLAGQSFTVCELGFIGSDWDEVALHQAPGAWGPPPPRAETANVWGQERSTAYLWRHPEVGSLLIDVYSGGDRLNGGGQGARREHILGIYLKR